MGSGTGERGYLGKATSRPAPAARPSAAPPTTSPRPSPRTPTTPEGAAGREHRREHLLLPARPARLRPRPGQVIRHRLSTGAVLVTSRIPPSPIAPSSGQLLAGELAVTMAGVAGGQGSVSRVTFVPYVAGLVTVGDSQLSQRRRSGPGKIGFHDDTANSVCRCHRVGPGSAAQGAGR